MLNKSLAINTVTKYIHCDGRQCNQPQQHEQCHCIAEILLRLALNINQSINQSIINNFHGSYQILEHTLKTTEFNQILILTWDRYKNVVALNQLI
jgi:hypothetical protein